MSSTAAFSVPSRLFDVSDSRVSDLRAFGLFAFFFYTFTFDRLTCLSSGIGDTPFKQLPGFTRRILYNLFPGGHDTSLWEEFLVRNLTPPYISAMPEVAHYPLGASPAGKRLRKYLVLASDGFTDVCGEAQRSVIERWLQCVESRSECGKTDNMAMQLLWEGLGGEVEGVSKVLTVDLDVPWLDDVSIVVQSL